MKLPGAFRPIVVTIGFLTLVNISATSARQIPSYVSMCGKCLLKFLVRKRR